MICVVDTVTLALAQARPLQFINGIVYLFPDFLFIVFDINDAEGNSSTSANIYSENKRWGTDTKLRINSGHSPVSIKWTHAREHMHE